MPDTRDSLLLFFDRPTEPIFMEKGDEKIRFNIPEHYYPKEYKTLMKPQPVIMAASQETLIDPPSIHSKSVLIDNIQFDEISDKTLKVPVQTLTTEINIESKPSSTIDIGSIVLPDLSLPMELPQDEQFSFFVPKHREMAGRLIDIFMDMNMSLEELMSLFAYSQMHINPYLFNYCVSVAILHRPDTKGMDIPTFAETFPDKFVDRKSMRRAREYCAVVPEEKKLPLIEINLPVNPKVAEHRLSYFREDIGLNSHHWHWHLIYPTDATNNVIVNKDRRGELFYYMHHQVMARYNTERMCNGLGLTKPYVNFREPIAEGYFPLLDSANASRAWAPRFDNIAVQDIIRPGSKIMASITDLETWYTRIVDATKSQSIQQLDGSQLPLDEETGIDILGNLVEATSISYNPVYYGDYHNKGHMLIAYIHDPEEKHGQQHSVMGDSATAMRDPIFYRWHAGIDNIFGLYKDNLTPYGAEKLVFPGINVSSIRIESPGGENTITTLWERSTMNLKNGLDFAPRRNIYAHFTHLQHEEFQYVIEVNNTSSEPQMGTFRIFMAPTEDQCGKPLTFDEQRKLMIEMDKFSQPLSSGTNTIRRSSMDSSVTIPFERIFRGQTGQTNAPSGFNFCDCGWPQYLLVPKGTTEGYPMVAFVMVSNWKEDKVERDLTGADNDNASYCGLRDQKYPDRRPMGFPFDRKPAHEIDSLSKFLQSNMAYKACTIKFSGITRDRDERYAKTPTERHHNVGGTMSSQGQGSNQTRHRRCDRSGLGGSHCGPQREKFDNTGEHHHESRGGPFHHHQQHHHHDHQQHHHDHQQHHHDHQQHHHQQ